MPQSSPPRATASAPGLTAASADPDESLYSRQIYAIGLDAMRKMAVADILIVGLRGLGVEIAKNVILAGVKSVTIYDPAPATLADLSSQFFLSDSSALGRPRDAVSRPLLAELNPYVTVNVLSGSDYQNLDALLAAKKFSVVVATSSLVSDFVSLNARVRNAGAVFIAADTRGLAALAFCDFGETFVVSDATGEEPLTGLISAISRDSPTSAVVMCLDESRHGLTDGDYVRFCEVRGLEGINEAPAFEVAVLGPYTFKIATASTQLVGDYVSGGRFTQVKMPLKLNFLTMEKSLHAPACLLTDFAKLERPMQLHVAFATLSEFAASHGGRVPRPRCAEDAEEFISLASSVAQRMLADKEFVVDKEVMRTFAIQAPGDLCPMAAVLGGLVAQEVIKACSGKLTPVKQYFYFDAFECIQEEIASPKEKETEAASSSVFSNVKLGLKPLTRDDCAPQNSRYDSQIAVFGREMQEFMASARLFLVGAGAIGCEMLKNWAMMGVATAENGNVCVTDMDTIEKSNLNRQFLFRPADVGKLKSQTAADAATRMNPALKIKAHELRVGGETENIFNDKFWNSIDVVTNALDNVEARKYVDQRCVFYLKPLLESGTLGVKGSTQVVLPHVTESYSSSQDPPEKSIPICTLKNFPNQIEHTIQWGRDTFEGLFTQPIETIQQYLELGHAAFVEKQTQANANVVEMLESVAQNLTALYPKNFDDCIAWARVKFDELFVNNIKQLLFNFPPDAISTSTGAPFWSGPKRAPKVIEFDANVPLHMDFIAYAAIIRAHNFKVPIPTPSDSKSSLHPCPRLVDDEYYKRVLIDVKVPHFVPVQGLKIAVGDAEAQSNAEAERERLTQESGSEAFAKKISSMGAGLDAAIKEIKASGKHAVAVYPASFEKDDDSNKHIDVVAACSNIRAEAYSIAPADRHKTKLIAGKIIPAIATTTSLVTGLVCLELYKLFADLFAAKSKLKANVNAKTAKSYVIEKYRNSFLTLAGPEFAFSEPRGAQKLKYGNVTFTLWDRFEFDDMLIGEFIEKFEKLHGLQISMISCGVTMLYSFFLAAKRQQERRGMLISKVYEEVSKKALPEGAESLVIEVCCNDENDEDVEVPYFLIKLGSRS